MPPTLRMFGGFTSFTIIQDAESVCLRIQGPRKNQCMFDLWVLRWERSIRTNPRATLTPIAHVNIINTYRADVSRAYSQSLAMSALHQLTHPILRPTHRQHLIRAFHRKFSVAVSLTFHGRYEKLGSFNFSSCTDVHRLTSWWLVPVSGLDVNCLKPFHLST